MSELTKGFGVLSALTIEAAVVLLLCWWCGDKLDSFVPIGIKWGIILFPIGFLSVGLRVYQLIKLTSKQDGQGKNRP